ncbi:MAG: LLM class flavin-dependent oxidoreductase, partial [Nitrososphaeria archaeon]|nr:LLM class flavin-dependent oxidoreductase [Nitrososphaeria archaeon]NIN53473.1 LLM class flavin-dependent oxidoreductase [Nitrososphaeria archaeon]NIQ33990.1 LLM class flavin-dependent oxidoreductase [Nitrososphaeria archaeon]
MSKIRFGAKLNILPEFCDVPDYEKLRDILLECEELGYHSAWVLDHLIWGRAGPLECWTTLSALASETRKIHLGPLVTCHSFRLPSVLAKMGATLDVISGGRLE